jgi:hypothetical protein
MRSAPLPVATKSLMLLHFRHQFRLGMCSFCGITVLRFGGLVMRIIATLAVLSVILGLGGCFHHQQVYTAEPVVLPPLK